jgi:hypothetical protein
VPRAPRDLVLLGGPEPSMRWRGFTQLIIDLAEALGVQLVVSLGALLADVPHTLPVQVSGSGSDSRCSSTSACSRPATRARPGSSACSAPPAPRAAPVGEPLGERPPLRRRGTPNPKAALALVRRLEGLVGVAVDASELEHAAADYERQVGLAVQSDPDVQAFVERLEQLAEDERSGEPEEIPSGDRLASEFQRFLRQRGGEGPPRSGDRRQS